MDRMRVIDYELNESNFTLKCGYLEILQQPFARSQLQYNFVLTDSRRIFDVNIYDQDLDKNPANYHPLTPLSFLKRSARVFPNKVAVIHGDNFTTYQDLYTDAGDWVAH